MPESCKKKEGGGGLKRVFVYLHNVVLVQFAVRADIVGAECGGSSLRHEIYLFIGRMQAGIGKFHRQAEPLEPLGQALYALCGSLQRIFLGLNIPYLFCPAGKTCRIVLLYVLEPLGIDYAQR